MLINWLIYASLSLLFGCLALFAFGHRLRHGHWLSSLLAIGVLSAAAWAAQQALAGSGPPLTGAMAASLALGTLVTAGFKDWNPLGHACFSASLFASLLYLAYAASVLMAAQSAPWSLAFGVVLLGLQAASLALLAVHTFEIIDVLCRTRWEFADDAARGDRVALPRTQRSDFLPKVSIHVPIHREPPAMVMETLDALARLDYPNFEVLVIDNNTPEESLWRPVEAHCARLGPRFRFFHLLPWPGYKSGALNFALGETADDAEIIGIVDSDYLAEPAWLSDLVGHFADPAMGFVQTPQDYRDVEGRGSFGKALALSYIYFFRISMASRNERNAIIFAGTMGLLRKSALVEVGGWDEWCITEDAEVSLRLLDAGYRSLYIDRTYGRGLMPLDYAGLKKQRFRWAFGGMQLLRMHAGKLLNPWAKGKLTLAQRWAYFSGGMQWLNDPLTLAFSVVLVVGASTLLLVDSGATQPLVGAALFVPPLFILFAVSRFLWALRIREGARCSVGDSMRSLAMLLGMTWVVTLACMRGLVCREGVFLRTPKQGEVPDLADSLRVAVWEALFGSLCVALAAALVVAPGFALMSARTLVVALLGWQALIYYCTVLGTVWDFQQRRGSLHPVEAGLHAFSPGLGRSVPEPRTALWVLAGVLALGGGWYAASAYAPIAVRLFRANPLNQLVSTDSPMFSTPLEPACAIPVGETTAAVRVDPEAVLAPRADARAVAGENHAPHDPGDDREWRGIAQVRERYAQESRPRSHRTPAYRLLHREVDRDTATIVDDLSALVENARQGGLERIRRAGSDRWTLHRLDGK